MATFNGTPNNDTLTGDGTDDSLFGFQGNDSLVGGDGNDSLYGAEGQDTLVGGAGNDLLDGGTITDLVNLTDLNIALYGSATSAVTVNLATGTASDGLGGTDTLVNINFVSGSAFNDTLIGSTTATLFEQFEGGLGDDSINGGAISSNSNGNRATYVNATSAVQVNLAAGTATGAQGNDTLVNINFVRGSAFGDSLTGSTTVGYDEFFDGRGGNDTIDGAGGTDWLRYDGATTGVNVNWDTGTATDGQGGTDVFFNMENARGSGFNDTINGSTGNNLIQGRAGNDFLVGNEGDDTLQGDEGQDSLYGTEGNDVLDGGAITDLLNYTDLNWAFYTVATTGVVVNLATGTAQDGLGGTDTLMNINFVTGSGFNDSLTGASSTLFEQFEGGAGNDTIDGGSGHDLIYGMAGNDSLLGGDGNDFLWGGSGNDVIKGGIGNDWLYGEAGADDLDGEGGDNWLFGGAGIDLLASGTGKNRLFQ